MNGHTADYPKCEVPIKKTPKGGEKTEKTNLEEQNEWGESGRQRHLGSKRERFVTWTKCLDRGVSIEEKLVIWDFIARRREKPEGEKGHVRSVVEEKLCQSTLKVFGGVNASPPGREVKKEGGRETRPPQGGGRYSRARGS